MDIKYLISDRYLWEVYFLTAIIWGSSASDLIIVGVTIQLDQQNSEDFDQLLHLRRVASIYGGTKLDVTRSDNNVKSTFAPLLLENSKLSSIYVRVVTSGYSSLKQLLMKNFSYRTSHTPVNMEMVADKSHIKEGQP